MGIKYTYSKELSKNRFRFERYCHIISAICAVFCGLLIILLSILKLSLSYSINFNAIGASFTAFFIFIIMWVYSYYDLKYRNNYIQINKGKLTYFSVMFLGSMKQYLYTIENITKIEESKKYVIIHGKIRSEFLNTYRFATVDSDAKYMNKLKLPKVFMGIEVCIDKLRGSQRVGQEYMECEKVNES